MKKTLVALSMLAATSVANAETFTVDVDVDVTLGEILLQLNQTQAMAFPQVKIDEATQEGSYCDATDSVNTRGFNNLTANNSNSLCPGLAGARSLVEFVGVPNAVISVARTAATQDAAGLRFTVTNGGTSNRTLSADGGTTSVGLNGRVTLQDKDLVTDGVVSFTYNITAAYQ